MCFVVCCAVLWCGVRTLIILQVHIHEVHAQALERGVVQLQGAPVQRGQAMPILDRYIRTDVM